MSRARPLLALAARDGRRSRGSSKMVTASRRTIAGALCSLGLHVALLVSAADAPREELPPTSPEDEIVAIDVLGVDPVSSTPREEGSRAAPVAAPLEGAPIGAPPESEPEPEPGPPRRERTTAEPEPRAVSEPEPRADAPEPSRLRADPIALVSDEARADAEDRDVAGPPAMNEPGSPATSDRHGAGSDGHREGGTFDGSSYGKEIVRIVFEEIDDNPVLGLKRTDAIQVLLHVKRDGSLAWRGSGRFGFARVLASTVGPIRTRAILKRIERASRRFPGHPAGMKPRRHYVVDMTLRFNRDLVGD